MPSREEPNTEDFCLEAGFFICYLEWYLDFSRSGQSFGCTPWNTDTRAAGLKGLVSTCSERWFFRWKEAVSDRVRQSRSPLLSSTRAYLAVKTAVPAAEEARTILAEENLAQVPSQREFLSDWIYSLRISLLYIRVTEDSIMFQVSVQSEVTVRANSSRSRWACFCEIQTEVRLLQSVGAAKELQIIKCRTRVLGDTER